MARLAFAGMGLMGAPMAEHLLGAGHRVAVWNRTAAKAAPLAAKGARIAAGPADLARGAEGIFLCLGDTPDVEAALFGPGGVAEGAERGALVVDCTTIAPEAEVRFGARLAERGVRFMDAPVTGGRKGALEGTLSFIVGAEPADLDRARPWLEAMGKRIFHAGPLGAGQQLKLVNQIACAIHLLALSESLAMARAQGLDAEQARELLVSGAARSWALEVYGEKAIKGDFSAAFSVKWQAKDIRIALDAAAKLGLRLPGTATAMAQLDAALARGWGEEGVQALAKLFG